MKNILVTGVSKGLGFEISKTLLEEGYFVYGLSRKANDNTDQLSKEFYDNFKHISYDLSDTAGIKTFWKENFLTTNIPVHGYINNAALAIDDLITNINLEKLEEMYRVNVMSPLLLTKNVLRNMLLHQTKGNLVHISSISAHTGYKGLAMYASTKGALEAFSKNTAREWGEKGIRSNCVVAGFMETEMSSKLDDETKNRIYKRTSLKIPTSTKSVAQTVSFLLSDKSASITGQNIFVDSGTI
ncbi:MAG: Short-chain dehydrogenase/reductase SDR [Candidatus Daviesbacteria bacterium GW2011_GWF2_38_6]|uniref:Short-chain dehydrogenase/reductase SDR n=1 Tax=Candidatus Daviesbacteria bacterium GW2011_GWF2_38_6 TaxID=1618432 RepID=A0A0G0KIA7_9BACT|nr:MAG: Short-chain dehydrogenase/reductase SDR [Candidatus Daviesbacteria bacterium GW2011_GWF2_38_6]